MTGLGSVGICFSYDTCNIPDYQLGSEAASILILAMKEERRIPSFVVVAFLVGGGGMLDGSRGDDGGCVSSG